MLLNSQESNHHVRALLTYISQIMVFTGLILVRYFRDSIRESILAESHKVAIAIITISQTKMVLQAEIWN